MNIVAGLMQCWLGLIRISIDPNSVIGASLKVVDCRLASCLSDSLMWVDLSNDLSRQVRVASYLGYHRNSSSPHMGAEHLQGVHLPSLVNTGGGMILSTCWTLLVAFRIGTRGLKESGTIVLYGSTRVCWWTLSSLTGNFPLQNVSSIRYMDSVKVCIAFAWLVGSP